MAERQALIGVKGSPRSDLQRRSAGVVVLSVCLLGLVGLMVSTSPRRTGVQLAQLQGDKTDMQYLQAEASGTGGKDFLKRLQEMWFVAKYR